MKKAFAKSRKSIISVILAAALFALTIIIVPQIGRVDSTGGANDSALVQSPLASVQFTDNGLKTKYITGDSFTVPAASIVTEDGTYPAERSLVVFPSKKAVDKSAFLLTESGLYTIKYEATVSGKTVTATTEFIVESSLYSFSGEKSSAEYGSHPVYSTDKKGIVSKIARGETMYFNKAVNLSGLTNSHKQISFFAIPTQIRVPDATKITIRYTDAYDSSNYVNIEARDVSFVGGDWAISYTYTMAAAYNQPLSGVEGSNVHVNDEFGHPSEFSLVGVPIDGGEPGSEDYTLRFNYNEKQIYDKAGMIIDFDESRHFTTLWDGFTTGECFISVSAARYQSSTLNLVFNEFFGMDLTQTSFDDKVAPAISVDFAGYAENNLPYALKDTAYKIFPAAAFDVQDGSCDVKTHVYYGYESDSPVNVNITGGKFVPTRTGDYTIVYEAADRSGNKAVKTIKVNCPSGKSPLGITLSGKSTVAGAAGQPYKVMDSITKSNVSGAADVKITAALNGSDTVYEVDTTTLEFIPMYKGTYTVTVSVSDYIQSKTETFTVTAAASDQPQFFDSPVLPKYMITGAQYDIPGLTGYDFSSGEPKEITAKISASVDGGAVREIDGKGYKVRALETLKIIYTITSAGGKTKTVDETVTAVDIGYGSTLNSKNYFKIINGTVSAQQKPMQLAFSTTTDLSSVEFINQLAANDFSMVFHVDGERNKFSALNVYLTDSADSTQEVKFSYINVAGSASVSINDGLRYTTNSNFDGIGENFRLDYNNSTFVFKASSSRSIPVTGYNNKNGTFKGFTSGKVYMRFEFEGVQGLSAINLYSINRTGFAEFSSDLFAPTINFSNLRGDRGLGDIVEIAPAFALDVLDPKVDFSLKVTDPDGDFVIADDGTVLDGTCPTDKAYKFKLSKYGDYMINYEAKDGSNNTVSDGYGISVVDTVKPVITLSDIVKTAKVGATVKLAKATATDDLTKELTINKYLITPYGNVYTLKQDAFEATMAGEYTVLFTVYDGSNNFTAEKYTVKVS